MNKKVEELKKMVEEMEVEGYAGCTNTKAERQKLCPTAAQRCLYDCWNGWSMGTPSN
ncbi:hypothetical protein [Clostridium botulinum]|uniref:hypothetical protein n=1 Tax=Clostridium botulinum TaxID=1491 RepID=UPI000AFCDDC2|nr:hypothetical protein [Clostridium botulinum]MBD5589593.1 hypothetical protein [Clostridium botulinum]HDI3121891.1 hypothetical protein [Clostridium botulinum]